MQLTAPFLNLLESMGGFVTGFLGKVVMAVPAWRAGVQGGEHGQGLYLFLSDPFSPKSTAVAAWDSGCAGLGLTAWSWQGRTGPISSQ